MTNRFKRALPGGGQPADPAAVASFIAGADAHEAAPAAGAGIEEQQLKILPVPEYDQGGGKLSEAVLFRCTPAVFQELDFVFKHTTAKSKQKLLEAILLPQLKAMAAEIRKGN
ncbi:hypothetical protein Ga0061063_0959 [Gulbenkiania indica]|uniref:Uncharacterized protein n=1 Tax=Gulbenkiania indica TaxID=375574 RepID=A0A0K6GUA6_9NEIS|nr:hypothetical protein [Gulbenkiania indica]CUA82104.1 hypothetical protein Ga0061063_0959 [Gulbenkiania indica]